MYKNDSNVIITLADFKSAKEQGSFQDIEISLDHIHQEKIWEQFNCTEAEFIQLIFVLCSFNEEICYNGQNNTTNDIFFPIETINKVVSLEALEELYELAESLNHIEINYKVKYQVNFIEMSNEVTGDINLLHVCVKEGKNVSGFEMYSGPVNTKNITLLDNDLQLCYPTIIKQGIDPARMLESMVTGTVHAVMEEVRSKVVVE